MNDFEDDDKKVGTNYLLVTNLPWAHVVQYKKLNASFSLIKFVVEKFFKIMSYRNLHQANNVCQ